ncbi:MAG: hypothetical protein M3135_06320 [Actinomycetota bacterium]|nr:hypothetical protein [Actinomycetota bacterium]
MRRFFRYAFLVIAAVFLTAIVVQVFFAGLMVFGHEGGRALHGNTGWIIHTAAFLFLPLPALARAGARTIVLGIVLFAITFVQPLLTMVDSTLVEALHPVTALAMFTLSFVLTGRARELVRADRQPAGVPA